MPTNSRAAQYAARLVEACWLAALVTVPLFFDVWSNRVFEPDKLTLLRSIALVALVGVVVWALEERRRPGPIGETVRRWLAVPIVAPLVALTAAMALSTATSIVPRQSLGGSYQRLQGLYTWLAYVTIFAAILAFMRRRDQLDRLITAVVLPSLPVALYGIIQNRGLDPMPWLGDVTARVASTMGNSIFVAAYLIMAVPLTIAKVVESLRALDAGDAADAAARTRSSARDDAGARSAVSRSGRAADPGSPGGRYYGSASVLRAAAYMVMLFVQVLGLVLSQSRGPLLGVGGALFVMLAVWAAAQADARRRRLQAAAVYLLIGVLPAAFLVWFNLAPAGSAVAGLRDLPYVGRLGRVLETEGGTGRVRVLIWQGAVDMVTADPVRALVGYGPESMHVAYNPYYPPELAQLESRNASPDRSHNETLDSLATTGVIGFLAYLSLFTALFYQGLRWLGLLLDRRDRNLFLALWLGGGLLSVVGFQLWRGDATFFGVALPAGMMAGLVHYLVVRAVLGWPVEVRRDRLLVTALLATLAGHFIEINFGIAIAATRTVFFALAAALVVVGIRGESLSAASPAPLPSAAAAPRARKSGRARAAVPGVARPRPATAWSAAACLMLAVLVTMAFDFLVRGTIDVGTPERLQEMLVMTWLFTLTWAIGSLALAGDVLTRPGASLEGLWRYVGISIGGAAAYAAAHQMVLSSGQGADTSSTLLVMYYVAVALLLALTAAVLLRGDPPAPVGIAGRAPWAYGAAAIVAAVAALVTNANEVRADIYYKEAWAGYHAQAGRLQSRGDAATARSYYESAITSYDRAIGLDPAEDYYLLFKGKAQLEFSDLLASAVDGKVPDDAGAEFSEYDRSETAAEAEARDQAFQRALTVLQTARDMAPHNTDHVANLARAYQVWGERTYDRARRAERLALSKEWFDRAIAQSPRSAGLRTELATTLYLSGDDAAALAAIDDALELDERYGRPYRLRATIHRENQDWEAAEKDYRRYVETRDGRGDAVGWSGLALVLGRLDRPTEAITANVKVLELAPGDLPTIRNLVLLHQSQGNTSEACEYARQGLDLAAEDPDLLKVSADLGCEATAGPVAP